MAAVSDYVTKRGLRIPYDAKNQFRGVYATRVGPIFVELLPWAGWAGGYYKSSAWVGREGKAFKTTDKDPAERVQKLLDWIDRQLKQAHEATERFA
jgi:hypothetical protein